MIPPKKKKKKKREKRRYRLFRTFSRIPSAGAPLLRSLGHTSTSAALQLAEPSDVSWTRHGGVGDIVLDPPPPSRSLAHPAALSVCICIRMSDSARSFAFPSRPSTRNGNIAVSLFRRRRGSVALLRSFVYFLLFSLATFVRARLLVSVFRGGSPTDRVHSRER